MNEQEIDEYLNKVYDESETPEQKEFNEYLKTIGVSNVSIITEREFNPRFIINFEDGIEEIYDLTREYLMDINYDWNVLLNLSEKINK